MAVSDKEEGSPADSGVVRTPTVAAASPVRELGGESTVDPDSPATGRPERITRRERPQAPSDAHGDTGTDHGRSDTLAAVEAGAGRGGPMIGRTLAGRFTILSELGRGGMSEVYVARHELLRKNVALKVLREDLAANASALERFHREAIAAANIGDPHIVEVSDFGKTEHGEAFLVMELLEGRDLRRTIREDGALPLGRAVAVGRQILRGLRAAHEQGIVHRDLKAENVFLIQRDGTDFVKILDFGISKLRKVSMEEGDDSTALTSTGMVMGTPQYIAPEQAYAQSDVDHRADIYAMGVILYEMITGGLPFTGDSALELMMQHVQNKPDRPSKRRPDLMIPADLERVVLKALEKDRKDRFESAEEMLLALPRSDELTGGFTSMSMSGYIPRPASGARTLLLLLAVLLFVGGGAATLLVLRKPPGASTAVAQAAPDSATPVRSEGSSVDVAAPRDTAAAPAPDTGSADVGVPKVDAAVKGPASFALTLKVVPRWGTIMSGKRLFRGAGTLKVKPGEVIRVRVLAKGFVGLRVTLKADPAHPTRVFRLRPKGKRKPSRFPKAAGGDLKDNPYTKK